MLFFVLLVELKLKLKLSRKRLNYGRWTRLVCWF